MKNGTIPFLVLSRWMDTPPFWRMVLFASGILCRGKSDAPKWQVLYGYAAEKLGKEEEAIKSYQEAVNIAQKSQYMSAVRWLQPSEFFLERMHHRQNQPREKDPLFSCTVEPAEVSRALGIPSAGCFKAEFTFSGLLIIGMVPGGIGKTVSVKVNGELLREFSVGRGFPYPTFKILIQRSTLRHFPENADLTLTVKDGQALSQFGRHRNKFSCRITVPHGTGAILKSSKSRVKLDKKGNIVHGEEYVEKRKMEYLTLYDKARDFFEKRYGRSLILLYGTLLGCYRNGDLIEGDDDFDTGYVSEVSDPLALKKEMLGVMLSLIEAGFVVSFNRTGRLFRLHAPGSAEEDFEQSLHLDVTPVWFQDGKAWSHNHFCMPSVTEDFLPVQSRTLRDINVYIPADSEKFLRRQYGPGWKVPDPSFIYHRAEMDKGMLANLAKAFITPKEYLDLLEVVEEKRKTNPSMGKLVSIGAESFYPLRGLEEDFD